MKFLFLLFTFAAVTTSAMADTGHDQGKTIDPEPDRTIDIQAGSMWFDADELQIAPGTTVRFRVENVSMIPHEFAIGSSGMQQMHRDMMQQGGDHHGATDSNAMADNHHDGMMNQNEMSRQSAAITIAPGETETLTWTAPQQGDAIEYACFLPGHYEAGMKGTVTLNSNS
ncbi:cupredoxin domain-containing protein [Salinicola sp. V024]|uniref:cupredoxin domain-containing protein n=1 Tax=Salinicola sp. V024 TaxID=3459609 RepID=UPI004043A229